MHHYLMLLVGILGTIAGFFLIWALILGVTAVTGAIDKLIERD